MRKIFLFIAFGWFSITMVMGQETLQLTTDKEKYDGGDTIHLTCTVPEWEGTTRLGTLNLLIEDIKHNNVWRLRYPIVDGYFQADLVLPPNIPHNQYMITGDLQPRFFQLTGKLLNRVKEDSVRYTMQLEDKSIIAGALGLNEDGAFRMPRHVFSGRAMLFFSAYKPTKGKNTTDIAISTPLDSAYKPLAQTTLPLVIGEIPEDAAFIRYRADSNFLRNNMGTLANVTVKGKAKTPVDKFDEENSSGYFKGDRAQVFSGLNGEFSGFISILDYLNGRVAGLNIQKNTEEFGEYLVVWRNEPTAFFVDEVPVDVQTIFSFPPSEIAMVKVFPPPFMGVVLGAGGGAIAIYSKRATLGLEGRYRNRFVIQGFSPTTSVLKVTAVREKD
jgi:hypothetical protein